MRARKMGTWIQMSLLTLALSSAAVYFLWMDVALYIQVQKTDSLVSPPNNQNGSFLSERPSYSPLSPLSVKLLFQGPTNHYIDEPLAHWTVYATNLAEWTSPNAISISSVFFGASAARCFMSDSLRVRQSGVFLFKVRDFLDSLDGNVARVQRRQSRMVVEPGTFGYFFDGICDAASDIFLFLSLGYFISKGNGFTLIDQTQENKHRITGWRKSHPIAWIIALITGQALLSSMCWNFEQVQFSSLLESDVRTEEKINAQSQVLKSSTMWMIIYFWRLLNPHSITQIILITILYNRTYDFFMCAHYIGYFPIILLAFISQIYANISFSTICAK